MTFFQGASEIITTVYFIAITTDTRKFPYFCKPDLWRLVQHTRVLTFKTTIPNTAKPLPANL